MRFLITLKKETVAKHSTFDSGRRCSYRLPPVRKKSSRATKTRRSNLLSPLPMVDIRRLFAKPPVLWRMAAKPSFPESGACGLYVVRGTQTVYSNVKLTAERDADTGGLVWKTESPTPLAGGLLDEHYYFYYPYQARASILGQGGCSPSSLR